MSNNSPRQTTISMTDTKTRFFQQQVAETLSKSEPLLTRVAWLSLTTLLALTLLIQLAYRHHNLLLQQPLLHPQLCRFVSCSSPIPARQPQLITVLEHQLMPSPNYPSAVDFRLTLANDATEPQLYPIIDFWFEDKEGNIAAQRYFAPEDYRKNSTQKVVIGTPFSIKLTMVSDDPNQGYQFKIR